MLGEEGKTGGNWGRPVTFVHRYRDGNSLSSVPEGPALSTVLSIFLRTVNTDDCQARMEKREHDVFFNTVTQKR